MSLQHSLLSAFLALAICAPQSAPAQQPTEEAARKEAERIAKWQPQIAAFEKRDAEDPPAPDGIVFVGSSTIGLWDLAKSFPDLPVINRGFGGSHLADTRAYLPRVVLKHKPRLVVVHAGGNDLNSGKSPAQAAADFHAIQQGLRAALPECRLAFIGLKPTIKRLALRDKERELNALIREYLADKLGATFIEADQPFCDSAGQPRADLLRADQLHLNDAGYVVLDGLVRPVLRAAMREDPPEPPAEFQKREFQAASGEALKYVVYVPKNLTAEKPVPFLIFLHGSSAECVTHERILRESNLQFWHGYGRNVQREPTILMAPAGGTQGWTSEARQQAVFGIIDALIKEFPVDRRRIYLQGFSLGGGGTWRYLQERPDFFAAANPQALGGRIPNPETIKHIPIWATVGADDRRGVQGMTANVAAIRAANGDTRGALTDVTDVNPRFTIFPSTNHGGAQGATQKMPGFMEWMYSQVNAGQAVQPPPAKVEKRDGPRAMLQDGDRLLFVGGRQIRRLEAHLRWSLGRATPPLDVRGRTKFEYNATLAQMMADSEVAGLIKDARAKFVVLASGQIQDGNPAVVANPSVEDMTRFIELIRQADKQAVLLMTWARNPAGRRDGLAEFRRSTAEIVAAVQEVRKQTGIAVIPSGLIFYDLIVDPPAVPVVLREDYLFDTPNSAEGSLGTLVNVAALYAVTTGKSPVGLPMWDAFDPRLIQAIQERVWQIVQDWQAGKVNIKPAERAQTAAIPAASLNSSDPAWSPVAKSGDRLYFIGNSFTGGQGGLHNHLRSVARQVNPPLNLETHARIFPGAPLLRMYTDEVVSEIKSKRNAVVVATSGGDADMRRFRDLVSESGSKLVVHMTWGRNPTINNRGLAGLREETARIAESGRAFEKETGVPVVPCGLIFWDLIADPPLPHLREDFVFVYEDIHQNSLGTLANVSAHYAMLTGRSPVGLPSWEPFDPQLVQAVQERTWQIVQDWKAGHPAIKPAPPRPAR